MILDIIVGPLPWKNLENRAEILHMKRRTSVRTMADSISHHISEIWDHIENLGFIEAPNYSLIHNLLSKACEQNNVKQSDEWDWHPMILQMDDTSSNPIESQKGLNDFDKLSSFSRMASLDSRPLLVGEEDEGCCCLIV